MWYGFKTSGYLNSKNNVHSQLKKTQKIKKEKQIWFLCTPAGRLFLSSAPLCPVVASVMPGSWHSDRLQAGWFNQPPSRSVDTDHVTLLKSFRGGSITTVTVFGASEGKYLLARSSGHKVTSSSFQIWCFHVASCVCAVCGCNLCRFQSIVQTGKC